MFPSLANAGDLEQWADRLDAPGHFPRLIRRLILATTDDTTHLQMRSGEGTRYSGYDGIVEATREYTFVPANLSLWEMGVDRRPQSKAESDYEKRTNDPLGIDLSQATFVFVTPRRWAGKQQWENEKRSSGRWQNVHVLDGDDLEAWLDLAPAVHTWISSLLGKDTGGIHNLETFSTNWRQATNPPLSPDLLISGRDDAAERIVKHLQGQPSVLTVRASSQEEALAFIAATCEQFLQGKHDSVFARTVIISTMDAWQRITLMEHPLILLPTFTPVEAAQATRQGHHVLIPIGLEIAKTDSMMILPHPSWQAVKEALQSMNLSQERASSLASVARRSMLSLRRQLSPNPELQQPSWASPEKGRVVLPALLVGSWDEAIEGDCDVIATLAGQPYEVVSAELVQYANVSDPPVRQVGTTWMLASKEDAWRLLARFLTGQDVERFQKVTFSVFSALDPALELPADKQWAANIVGRSRLHSSLLREGVADTVALIATRTGDERLGGTATGQNYATAIVTQLLQKANEDSSGRIWTSLSDVLPLLAEAAPSTFLSAIDIASAGTDPVILKLFTDQTGDAFTSRSAHPSLLWALERLAWSPDYLSHAVLSLARLARLDLGGRLSNRPGSSLRAIFLTWYPQTTATFEQRLQVLDMLRVQEPAQSWKLILALLPKSHGEGASLTNSPQWREWKPEEQDHSFTYTELWSATEALVTRLLEDIGTNSSYVCDVVERVGALPPSSRALVLDYLESLDPSSFDNNDRDAVWAKLRLQISSHRRFARARWAMPHEDINRLIDIYECFTPEDPIHQVAWLFTNWPPLPNVAEDESIEKYGSVVYEAQVLAAQQVYQAEGLAGLYTLIEVVEQPHVLGWILGKSGLVETEEDHLLAELGSSAARRRQTAREYTGVRFRERGWEWADEKIRTNSSLHTPYQRADFFLSLPPAAETWNRLERFEKETIAFYWTQFVPRVEDAADCLRAIEQLLAHGQAWYALDLLALYLDQKKITPSTEIVMQVLENAINTPIRDAINPSIHHDVSLLFNYLDQDENVDEERLVRLEWAFLPIFRYEKRSFKILHSHLATNPAFFVDVVSMVFRANDEEPPRELDEQEFLRARVADDLLHSAKTVPGTREDGTIDKATLTTWVSEVRRLLIERKRLEIGDQQIGHILHYGQQDADGVWPPKVIRDLLEVLRSENIEKGIEIAIRNDRGVTWRGPTDGGQQEQQIMQRYLSQAQTIRFQWPRTTALLKRLGEAYAEEAQRHDLDAELRQDRW